VTAAPGGAAPVDPPAWPGDHDAVRALWTLDPEAAFLNHGSFGATPRPVLEEQDRWRARLEHQPVDFLARRYWGHVAEARAEVAAFLGADPDGLVFVPNASTGIAAAVAALVRPGDRVVVSDHVYAAVFETLRRAGADVVAVPLEPDAPDLAAPLLAAVDERTRLVAVDAVTSATGLVLPVADVVRGCRERGVVCVVDAAHAPGLLPVDLRALDPDVWAGNLHKWCCAPKGAAVLYLREEWRDRVHPAVASHGTGLGLHAEFDWLGTFDPSPWLSAPAALRLMGSLGWDAVRAYGAALAAWGAAATGLPLPVPRKRRTSMALLDAGLATYADALALRDAMWEADRVEVGATTWRGRGWLRLSAAPYNRPSDYERLAAALRARMPS
jgi:isopenicillin-N epimerase